MEPSAAPHRDGHRALRRLAALHGVQLSYRDALERWRVVSETTLVGVLRALGSNVTGAGDAVAALAEREATLDARRIEPVVVAWGERAARIRVRLRGRSTRGSVTVELRTEEGQETRWRVEAAEELHVPLPRVPAGYHHLRISADGRTDEALIVAAPERCAPLEGRSWGTFLPLYAVRTDHDRGTGNLGDLRSLMTWTAGLGGRLVATLPLFATFADGEHGPFEPSPYSPVSRLFWNELFVDVERLPEFERSPRAGSLFPRLTPAETVKRVDYQAIAAGMNAVLGELSSILVSEPSDRLAEFERWRRSRPEAVTYARFRAAVERTGIAWRAWPERMREGRIEARDVDQGTELRHLYAQWVAEAQLDGVVAQGRARGVGLLLDLPLGVHADGFDVWRDRAAFVDGASAGAPPDRLFMEGQDWGFPPMHPERLREGAYRYPIACVRALMRRASVVRVDHVMGLHRLFFVPRGMRATEGTYVTYPGEEWYAIIALESVRSGCAVVGEDLGTVRGAVRRTMRRRGVLRTSVTELEIWPRNEPVVAAPPAGSLAALDTHDLVPFAGYLHGQDIADRQRLGLADEATAADARAERQRLVVRFARYLAEHGLLDGAADGVDDLGMMEGALAFLAGSDAAHVLVNLEDLWGERLPQNVPGTGIEEPNWRRRARLSLEDITASPAIVATLQRLDQRRRAAPDP
jgi:4-alpha-glucanotransferase